MNKENNNERSETIQCDSLLHKSDIVCCIIEYMSDGGILPFLLVSKSVMDCWKLIKCRNEKDLNTYRIRSNISEFCQSVSILEWAIHANIPINSDLFICVCANGNLNCVKMLRLTYNCPWDSDACSYAAWNGHLHILQWLRSQDPPCPWDSDLCSYAAWNGHLHVLQWARSQDPPCPWESDACNNAATKGHLHVLQWLRNQNPPCPWDSEDEYFYSESISEKMIT
jgi:hypothetical protein